MATIYFGKESGSGSSQYLFLSHHQSDQTLQSRHLRPFPLLELGSKPQEALLY